jgi:hypothetical protein
MMSYTNDQLRRVIKKYKIKNCPTFSRLNKQGLLNLIKQYNLKLPKEKIKKVRQKRVMPVKKVVEDIEKELKYIKANTSMDEYNRFVEAFQQEVKNYENRLLPKKAVPFKKVIEEIDKELKYIRSNTSTDEYDKLVKEFQDEIKIYEKNLMKKAPKKESNTKLIKKILVDYDEIDELLKNLHDSENEGDIDNEDEKKFHKLFPQDLFSLEYDKYLKQLSMKELEKMKQFLDAFRYDLENLVLKEEEEEEEEEE